MLIVLMIEFLQRNGNSIPERDFGGSIDRFGGFGLNVWTIHKYLLYFASKLEITPLELIIHEQGSGF
jgi:hypothetical protein